MLNLNVPKLTVDAVIEAETLLVEFNDGDFKAYYWNPGQKWNLPSFRWLTPEQLVALVRAHNLALRPVIPRGYHPPSSLAGAAFWR